MAVGKIKKVKFFFLIICIIQLFYIFHFRSGFKYEIIKSPFNENSGIAYAVSPAIIESRNFLEKYKIKDFGLSQEIKKDNYLYQRSLEFNYPIKFNDTSRFIFFLNEENVPENCDVVDNGKYLKLIKC
tara:strand:- start:178 stop:561 length:384 start_codon:yes stop_codon:yes gene_type:complete